MKGNDLLIYTNADGELKAIAAAKSCDIEHNCETIEVSSPYSALGREYIAGRRTWRISVNGLVGNPTNILAVGTKVMICVYYRTTLLGPIRMMEGDAIITSMKETASRGALVTYSMTLQGTGDLKPASTPAKEEEL